MIMCRYMGHFCGALAGLLVGIAVLDNRVVETWETWVSTQLIHGAYTTHTELVSTNLFLYENMNNNYLNINSGWQQPGGKANILISHAPPEKEEFAMIWF